MENIMELVEQWSENKGLDKADSTKQLLKLMEEVGELASSHAKSDHPEVIDAIGDIMVVLTIYCQQNNLNLIDCYASAYDVIKDRTGKMHNGVFLKDE